MIKADRLEATHVWTALRWQGTKSSFALLVGAANLPRDGVRFVIAAVMRYAAVVQAVQSSNSASDRLREFEDKSCDTSDAAGLGTHLKYDTGQLSQLLFERLGVAGLYNWLRVKSRQWMSVKLSISRK